MRLNFRLGEAGPGLLLTRTGARLVVDVSSGPGPGPVPDGLSLHLAADYVDTSGNFLTAVADNDTTPTITGVAPFVVWFDGTASVSVATDADTPGKAWRRLNCRFNSGEWLSGNWSISGMNKNVVEGPGAVMGHVFTSVGTHHLTMTRVDSEGRQGSIGINVVCNAPPAPVIIEPSAGAWPTWVSGTHYALRANGDYRSFGTINLSGLHNILISKIGSGADPRVSQVNFDSRNTVSTPTTRPRNCRTDGINAAYIEESSIGPLHCAVINHSGSFFYGSSGIEYHWPNVASDNPNRETIRNNMARSRAVAFWNCADITSRGDSYVFIGQAKNWIFRNCQLRKTTGNGAQHVFRGDYDGLDLRGNRFLAEAQGSTYIKATGWENGFTFDAWPALDRFGPWNGAPYKPVAGKIVIANNVLGGPGGTNLTGFAVEVLPENNAGNPLNPHDPSDPAYSPEQGHRMTAVYNNVAYVTSQPALWMRGQDTICFNNYADMGAGVPFGVSLVQRDLRVPPSLDGPNSETPPPAFLD